jgi:membrane protein required for colicin V production
MIVDIIYLFLIIAAVIKGYERGFIVAVFSYIAIVIGLAAALKLSSGLAALLLQSTHLRWLPFFSFVLVMIGVVFIVRLFAGLIQKSVRLIMLGGIDRLGGILLYAALYTTVFSVVLFFAGKVHLLPHDISATSKMYGFIAPWGPNVINGFAVIIPWFKDMFSQLEAFFGSAAIHN